MIPSRCKSRQFFGTWVGTVAVLLIGLQATVLAQPPNSYQLADLKCLQDAFVELASDVRPSVVAIQSYLAREDGQDEEHRVRIPVSRGSGLVIDSAGLILTNRHVLEEANSFTVVLDDGQRFDATVVGTDPRSDLAVVRIEATGLKPVRFGSATNLKVNQWSFAVGNPFGLAGSNGHMSVSYGVVSALERNMTPQLAGGSQLQYYGNLIETTAAINPGSSGGPLFNIDGEVIGIATAIETSSGVSEGVGFAIPVDRNLLAILEKLKAGETVRYGFLGVSIRDARPPRARHVVKSRRYPGVVLTGVNPVDGPAGKAGLKKDDIVIEFDGQTLKSADHLIRLVNFTPVGTEVPMTYLRKRVKRKAMVTIGDRYKLLALEVPE